MNSIGELIRLTTFGESHGPEMGGVLDGMPPLVLIDLDAVRRDVARRRPGHAPGVSQRKESDEVEILSGIAPDGRTLGTPIGFIVRNRDARSEDYAAIEGRFRPNHADYTYWKKYGIHDFRGGGRSSARETVSRVVAGAICRQWLDTLGVSVCAELLPGPDVDAVAARGDSVGGAVRCVVTGLPVGVGEPVYDKLNARLAAAMMSINAVKAFETGDGVAASSALGSESVDRFVKTGDGLNLTCESNHSGGVQGGISNGMPVTMTVHFKPAPTLMRPVETFDTEGNEVVIPPKGRHDPCVAVRAVPVVEAMAILTVADMMKSRGCLTR